MVKYDVIIIGGGPAGLTAAIYTSRDMLRTLVLEKELCGGLAAGTDLIENYPDFAFRRKRNGNPSGYIVETLRVVFEALFDTDNFEDCLVHTVNQGGDADTTGAIAGMIAGAVYGPGEIPNRWRRAIDPAISSACREQAQALLPKL